MNRRHFISATSAFAIAPQIMGKPKENTPLFEISLAQWSNHRALRAGEFTNLEWPQHTKEQYDIHALEYVSSFFKDKAEDAAYIAELNKRVNDLGMQNLLIMVDGEGHLGLKDPKGRAKSVDNHKKWVTAAKTMGCHSIRVDARGDGSKEELAKQVTDGLHQLASFAAGHEINVIVENHGGPSSDGEWLSGVLTAVNLPNCGSLPDFGNFYEYDRYQGIRDLMPFAKSVSAKSYDFDEEGNETKIDFRKALKIVLDANYRGHIGVEYEGKRLSEDEGVQATKALLEKIREEVAGNY